MVCRFINRIALRKVAFALCAGAATGLLVASCGEPSDVINTAENRIISEFKSQNVYERGNLPDDPPPATVSGYFDIIGGAYRYIVNEYILGEEREFRNMLEQVATGDSISFMFDAREYSGSFSGSKTFYTNIESRRQEISGNNPQFNTDFWPTEPLRIKVGSDNKILKSVQDALISCRAAGERTVIVENDVEGEDGQGPTREETVKIESDVVRIYLTPDIGFGSDIVYQVPANSTLVFEVTDIQIIK